MNEEKNPWKKVEMSPSWNGSVDGQFKLKKGDELIGTYDGKEEDVGENHSNVYTLKTEGGMMSVWGSTVLDVRLKNIEQGEQVKIVYLGKQKSEKGGREYHNYDVFHRKPVFEDIPVIEEGEGTGKTFKEQIEE